MAGALPDDLQQFIARYIDSVEKLEVVLLLAGSPDRFWTLEEVFQKIQSSQPSLTQRLRELINEGFAQRDDTGQKYRFQPRTAEIASCTVALATAYRERRIKVIEAIFSRTDDQIRRFSDAFRLRKEDE